EARARADALGDAAGSLRLRLDALRRPLADDQVARLSAADLPAGASAYREIDALLATPFPLAGQRAALVAALWSVGLRLSDDALRLGRSEGRTLRASPPPASTEVEEAARRARARRERRERRAAELLALAMPGEREVVEPSAAARAWADLPRQLPGPAPTPDPAVHDRRAR